MDLGEWEKTARPNTLFFELYRLHKTIEIFPVDFLLLAKIDSSWRISVENDVLFSKPYCSHLQKLYLRINVHRRVINLTILISYKDKILLSRFNF